MGISSYKQVRLYRSPLRVVAAMLWRSRETHARRAEESKEEIDKWRNPTIQQQALLQQAKDETDALKEQVAELHITLQALENQPVRLPNDPVLPCHHYGPRMIALSINLAQKV
ncbi:MAG: hypothetical protein R6U98_35830, partial [Pirellulaceae bacterium]